MLHTINRYFFFKRVNILKQSSFLPCQTLAIFWRNTFKPGTSKPESYKHYWLYLSPFFFFYSWFRPSQEANLPGIGHVVLLTCSTTVRVLLPQKPVNKDWSTYRKEKKQRYTVLNLLSDIETELTHWKVRPFADSVGHVWRCDSFQELV